MGARVYDPYTGTFTQPDPIQGGGANAYGYTDGDPINELDLGGEEPGQELIGGGEMDGPGGVPNSDIGGGNNNAGWYDGEQNEIPREYGGTEGPSRPLSAPFGRDDRGSASGRPRQGRKPHRRASFGPQPTSTGRWSDDQRGSVAAPTRAPDPNRPQSFSSMTPSNCHHATCPHCGSEFEYERFHAGFSNEGYMYCNADETVLTWSAYNSAYARLSHKLPWMLDAAEKRRVEDAVKRCPHGGRFGFDNPPRCPICLSAVAFLAPSKEYFIVTGRRIDAEIDDVWTT